MTGHLRPDDANEPLNLRAMVRAAIADAQFERQHAQTPLERLRAGVRGYVAVLRLVFVSLFLRGNTRQLLATLILGLVGSGLLLFPRAQNVFRGALFASAILVTWLTSQRPYAFRVVGHMIAAVVIAFCAWIVFILIADNGIDGDLRLGGVITIVDCAVVIGLMFRATLHSVRLAVP